MELNKKLVKGQDIEVLHNGVRTTVTIMDLHETPNNTFIKTKHRDSGGNNIVKTFLLEDVL